jgi:hypothetical protein
MTLQEAVSIVKRHQEWRLGAEIEMSEPKILTQAIDTILSQIEERYTKQEFLDTAEFCEVSMIDAKYIVSRIDEVRTLEKNRFFVGFVGYQQSLAMKSIGFNEPCLSDKLG